MSLDKAVIIMGGTKAMKKCLKKRRIKNKRLKRKRSLDPRIPKNKIRYKALA